MRSLTLLFLALGSLIKYNFKTTYGQLTPDLSGNDYYAVLGKTLLKEDSDPLPTDRGLYFTASSLVTLPPNAIQPTKTIPLTNFYMIFFLYSISPGRIITFTDSGAVKISFESLSTGTMEVVQDVSTQSSVSVTFDSSKKYLDVWVKVGFTYKFAVYGFCYDVYMRLQIGSLSNLVTTGTELSSSILYKVQLGEYEGISGFNGFMSNLYIIGPNECLSAISAYLSATFPESNPDPFTSSSGASCSCESYSCTGASLACIKCDSTCGEYCKTPSDCIQAIEICKPYSIINGICDVNKLYLQNCNVQESSTLCIVCDTGYNLSTDRSTCCLTGYFMVSPQVCAGCESTCSECTGPTMNDCLTCSDSQKTVRVDGSCVCVLGSDPVSGLCNSCLNECSTCETSSTCTGCLDINAVVNGTGRCECDSGFYDDSSLIGVNCLNCHQSCLSCFAAGSSSCIECSDLNSSPVGGVCTCNPRYVKSPVTGVCESCNTDCLNCASGLVDGCTQCSDLNAELISSPGICSCKSGYVETSQNPLICSICHETCETCSGVLINQCITCKDSLAAISSSVCICNSGFSYATNFACSPCHPDCLECSNFSQDSCLSCKSSHSILLNESCICETGFTATSQNPLMCEPCHPNCESCSGPNITDCLACKSPFSTLINSNCECIPGYTSNNTENLQCVPCHASCKICSGLTENSCLSCKDPNALLINDQCACIDGLYYNESLNSCEKCPNNCSLCSGNGICESCGEGCERCENDILCQECGKGYFFGSDFECVLCYSSCETCVSENENGCLNCANQDIVLKDSPGRCGCSVDEYVFNLNPLECMKCPDGCRKCTEFKCLECGQGFALVDGVCNRDELELVIDVLANNTILFSFSEFLMNPLKTDEFTTQIEGQAYFHSLQMTNKGLYEVNIEYTTFTVQQVEAIIIFHLPIVSESNSLLLKTNYNCILIRPKQNGFKLSPLLNSLSNSVKYSVIGSGLTSMFINSNQGSIWVTFNTIQTLSYIPLINVKIPDFLKFFLIGVRPITILPNFWNYFGILTCDTPQISRQFYDYGFTCKNFLLNCGEFLFVFSAGIGIFVLLSIAYIFSCKQCKVFVYKQLLKFRYAFFIRFWIQSYVELMLATVISINFVRTI